MVYLTSWGEGQRRGSFERKPLAMKPTLTNDCFYHVSDLLNPEPAVRQLRDSHNMAASLIQNKKVHKTRSFQDPQIFHSHILVECLKKKNLENIRWAETYGVMHIPSRSFQYCSFFQKPPLENMDYIKLSQQERTSLQQLLQDLFLSLAPPFSSLFLFFFFFFPAWLLQLPPGWGCSPNPNKTPFFSYWPSWHVMENQANYPYSCFHLLFM